MPGQPQSRANELLDRINGLSARDRDNAILMKTLERQAQQILAIDAACGYSLLGALATARRNIDDMKANHDRAVRAGPNQPHVFRNYAISLSKLGSKDEAVSMARRALELDESQPQNVTAFIQFAFESGRLGEAAAALTKAGEQFNEAHLAEQFHGDLSRVQDAAALLSSRGISDRIASAIAGAAFAIAPTSSVTEVASRVSADDEYVWLDFSLSIEDSVEKVVELNLQLAERMAQLSLDSEFNQAIPTFVVRFTTKAHSDASSAL